MKTYVIKINPKKPEKDGIETAAKAIREGKLVAFPTETVYGVAANFLDADAIDRLYSIKGRPKNKPFTVHISDITMIEALDCSVTAESLRLISRFWPGPLTVVLNAGDNKTLGFRIPANKVALDLIKAAAVPIVAPSANLSGNAAPLSAEDVLKDLDGKIDILLDSGKTDIGVESTVIDLTQDPPKVLREGAITKAELSKFLKKAL